MAQISDYDLAVAAKLSYSGPDTWAVAEDVAGVLTQVGGINVVAFRGTRGQAEHTLFGTLFDIRRDLDAIVVSDPQLGRCHQGFLTGGRAIAPLVRASVEKDNWIAAGHSLGGALAVVVSAIAIVEGWAPKALVTFGAPKVGFSTLRGLFDGRDVRQYRNGNDPVPDVPTPMPPWFPYEHIRLLTGIGKPDLLEIPCHVLSSYIAALKPPVVL